jgi:O-antigen ligase
MATEREASDARVDRRTTIGWLTVILAFSLPLYRPWLTLAATLVMLIWTFGGGLRADLARLKGHRLSLAILVFVALNLVSLTWSSDVSEGLRYVSKYRYLLLIPMFASAVPAVLRRRAQAAFQIGAALSVGLSLAAVFLALQIGKAEPGNPSATMAHIDYTLILAVASLLALTRALYGSMARFERLLWVGSFAVTATGLLVNIGRSGQLGFLVGLAVLLLRRAFDASRRVFAASLLVALACVAAVWVLAPPAVQRLGEAAHELRTAIVDHDFESNIGGRLAAMEVAGRIVRENPLLGTGVGGNMPRFRVLLDTEFQKFKPAIYWYPHFHNQYAQIASELGLAGLASFAWIFWALVRGPYRSKEIAAAASVVASVYLAGFLGEPFLHKQIPLIAFVLAAGLLSNAQLDEADVGSSAGE